MITLLSRALQPFAPARCRIVDADGRPVTLCSAGYVLRPGRAYRVEVIAPFGDDDYDGVTIQTAPEFIQQEPSVTTPDSDGNPVRAIPFSTRSAWNSFVKRLFCQFGELKIQFQHPASMKRTVVPYSVPVVLKPYLTAIVVVVAAALLSLAWGIVQETFAEVAHRPRPVRSAWKTWLQHMLGDADWMLIVAAAMTGACLAVAGWNVWRIRGRSRQLRTRFRATYGWDALETHAGRAAEESLAARPA
jgi:hypothetical protein